jgi:SAM-dependent methyltransferase
MAAGSWLRRTLMRFYYASVKVFCPGLRNSQFAYRESLTTLVKPNTDWLDLGCGHQFFPDWMPDSLRLQQQLVNTCGSVTGVDAFDPRPHSCGIPKIIANIEQLPFPNNSFSLITANMVVEHVENPERLLREVHRVLVPGGVFLFHTPNARYFEVAIAHRLPSGFVKRVAGLLDGRASDDIFPTFYRMNRDVDIRKAAVSSGLKVDTLRHVECTAQGVMLGPLVILELLIIRLFRLAMFERLRSDLVVRLTKPIATNERAAAGSSTRDEASQLSGTAADVPC